MGPGTATGCKTARGQRPPHGGGLCLDGDGRLHPRRHHGVLALDRGVAGTIHAASTSFPTENESYKAAYYKTGGTNAGYWQYPSSSNTPPVNTLSATGTNNANFFNGSTYTVSTG